MERSMILETVEKSPKYRNLETVVLLASIGCDFFFVFQLALQLPEEVVEFVDFLKNPKKYQQLGEGQGIFALCPVGLGGKVRHGYLSHLLSNIFEVPWDLGPLAPNMPNLDMVLDSVGGMN